MLSTQDTAIGPRIGLRIRLDTFFTCPRARNPEFRFRVAGAVAKGRPGWTSGDVHPGRFRPYSAGVPWGTAAAAAAFWLPRRLNQSLRPSNMM